MPFKVAARTILQLGAELISSDGIAFYELIKNAFDAGSSTVEIDLRQRVSHGGLQALRRQLNEMRLAPGQSPSAATLKTFRAAVASLVDATVPGAPEFFQQLTA